ncbi:MAG: hypothetical protein CMM52_02895 [Rhodospirillaceae bacterium]|nr:hypothetical protein [Rhodospirillaceae bacterium]|tara:strand:+ start:8685 stop:9494 length:810 start_codon:yes stop_codon:yes gene_type:complete
MGIGMRNSNFPGSQQWKSRSAKIIARSLLAVSLGGISGCVTLDQLIKDFDGTEVNKKQQALPAPETEVQAISKKGVEALRKNELKKASKLFNRALKIDIQNSYLQLLNGMAYHMQAVRSDTTLFSLAQQGYNLAIKFDPSNWIARYQLGLLHRDQRKFGLAKEAFADALFYKDDDPDILFNLAVSSYYSRDPETAAGALKRLRELEPNSAISPDTSDAQINRLAQGSYQSSKSKFSQTGGGSTPEYPVTISTVAVWRFQFRLQPVWVLV